MKQNDFSTEFTAKSTLDINALKAELLERKGIREEVAEEQRQFKEREAKRNAPKVFLVESILTKSKQRMFVVTHEEYVIDRWMLSGYICGNNGEWEDWDMALSVVGRKMALGLMVQIQ